jgi:uncharacterized protein (TIGR03435 family)
LHHLLRSAYDVQQHEVVGGPDWLTTDRYDIVLQTAPMSTRATSEDLQLALQAFLASAFGVEVHEARQIERYRLKAAGRSGQTLRPAAVDCAQPPPPPLLPVEPASAIPSVSDREGCGIRMAPGRITGRDVPMQLLANTLAAVLERGVVDDTGLAGRFDIDLEWAPSVPLVSAAAAQLGLRLDAERVAARVLVVDRASAPYERP